MPPRPYAALPLPVAEVAQALARAPQWRWFGPSRAVFPDGRLLDVRTGAAPEAGAVPYLVDRATIGGLLDQLGSACEPGITWEAGQRRGRGRTVYWVRLTAGVHAREFHGECLGEAVGRALLARWARMPGAAAVATPGWSARVGD